MSNEFFREIEDELVGTIMKYPNSKIDWGCVQNNEMDKKTKPYSIYRFRDLKLKLNRMVDSFDKMYLFCRWFRYWCAKCDENSFCWKGKAIMNPKQSDKNWDIKFNHVKNVDDIEFDVKSTRMPKDFTKEEKDFYQNNPEKLIEWFYQNQSKGERNAYQNRFFIIHLADDRRTENIKRVSFDKKRVLIDKYFQSIESGEHLPYTLVVDGHKVISDVLFV